MCTVRDSVHGLDGSFYVQSVYCVRDEQGDRTQVTLRRPDGSQAGQWFLTGASGGFAAGTSAMTQTGTYVLTIDPQGGSIGSVTPILA